MCGPSQLPQQQCSRMRSRGMPAIASFSAATCISAISRNSATLLSWNSIVRSIARSGASICSTKSRGDQLVFLAHLAGEREDIGLVAVVVRVQHRGGDDAGRRRRHEGVGGRRGQAVERRLEHAALLLGRRQIVVDDVGDRLRRVATPCCAWASAGASARRRPESPYSRAAAAASDSPPKPFMRCAT